MTGSLPTAPGSYALRAGEVHIWHVPLHSTTATLGQELPALLSEAETERSSRFKFERDRARFITCRASLRILLSRYTGAPPDKLVFRYEPGGKPALAGIPGWQFNVSHSRDQAAIAISRFDPLGIDLELIDPGFPRDDVAPDVLAPDEVRDLRALPASAQPAYFFQLWTLKEALLKSVGAGLLIEPVDIHIRLDQTLNPAIISAPPQFSQATIHRFTLVEGYASAIAILAPTSDLTFLSLSPESVLSPSEHVLSENALGEPATAPIPSNP